MFNTSERTVNKHTIADLLRMFMGRGKMPAETVAQFTGIPKRTVSDHIYSGSATQPNASHMAAYCRLFGPAFTNVYLSMFGQGGAVELTPEPISVSHHMTGTAGAVLTFSQILEDGIVDHNEWITLEKLAHERVIANTRLHAALSTQNKHFILEAA